MPWECTERQPVKCVGIMGYDIGTSISGMKHLEEAEEKRMDGACSGKSPVLMN